MKQILGILVAIFAFTFTANGQQLINVNGVPQFLDPADSRDVPDGLKAIQYKKYLTKDYKPARVDDYKQKAFLRYNIYDDEMEFVKGNNIYYLKKDEGRKVRFDDNQKFVIYSLNGETRYFLAHFDGKSKLLARQVVKFIEATKAESSYDRDEPADYKRKRDELYIALNGQELVKVPRKKKSFYALFGSKTSDIKKYMKENKLGYKKAKDLKKVVEFYDTL